MVVSEWVRDFFVALQMILTKKYTYALTYHSIEGREREGGGMTEKIAKIKLQCQLKFYHRASVFFLSAVKKRIEKQHTLKYLNVQFTVHFCTVQYFTVY
jgi:hypothetical protein